MNAADGAFAQNFAATAKQFRWPTAGAGVEFARAFHKTGAIQKPAEVLLVQFEPGDGFHKALQVQQREALRR